MDCAFSSMPMQIGDLTERDRRAIEAQVAASGSGQVVEAVLTEVRDCSRA